MLRFFKKSSKTTPLGRWGAIVSDNLKNEFTREKSIDFNSNWSNHDHCGAESCQIVIPNEKETNNKTTNETKNATTNETKNATTNETNNKKTSQMKSSDYYYNKEIMEFYPYLL